MAWEAFGLSLRRRTLLGVEDWARLAQPMTERACRKKSTFDAALDRTRMLAAMLNSVDELRRVIKALVQTIRVLRQCGALGFEDFKKIDRQVAWAERVRGLQHRPEMAHVDPKLVATLGVDGEGI